MSYKIEPASIILRDLGLEHNGDVHKFFTQECARYMDKYVPYRTGTLAHTVVINGNTTANVETSKITYDQEYASYVYNGITKTGKKMHYTPTFHRWAGDHWDERMKSADMISIEKSVQDYIDRRYYGKF